VDMQRLLKATMRLRPDRIIVGEVRGGEALSLLKAWNTGHPGGVCTVHANHARAGLQRVEQLIAEVSQTPMRPLIAEAVNLIVSIVKTGNTAGRRIEEVVAVTGCAGGEYQFSSLE
jgi:type IV secretion system protein TrbB